MNRARAGTTIAVFSALTLAFFWRVVAGQLLCWGDVILQFWPWHRFTRMLISDGRLPLWNPYEFCGEPFLANPQTAVLYPPNLLALPLPAHSWVTWSSVLHVSLCGVFMTLYLRALGCSAAAQIIGACALAFSGCVIARLQFMNHMVAFAALPCLLWVYETSRQSPARLFTGAAITTTLLWLGGHPQMNFIVLCLFAFYVVASSPPRHCLVIVAALFVGTITASIQLLPAIELVMNSSRAERSGATAHAFAVPPWQLIVWLFPDFFGNPARSAYWGEGNFFEVSPYVGVVTLMLAAVSVSSQHRLRWLLLSLFVIGVLLGMGHYAPFYPLLCKLLPPLTLFRAAGRWMLFSAFAVSTLAALGWDLLVADRSAQQRAFLVSTILATLAGLGGCVLVLFNDPISQALAPAIRHVLRVSYKEALPAAVTAQAGLSVTMPVFWLLLFALTMRSCAKGLGQARSRGALVAALVFADMFMFGAMLNPTAPPALFENASMQRQPLRTLLDHPGQRFATPQRYIKALWSEYVSYAYFVRPGANADFAKPFALCLPSTNIVSGIYNAAGYNPVRLRNIDLKLHAIDDPEAPTNISGWRELATYRVAELKDDRVIWKEIANPRRRVEFAGALSYNDAYCNRLFIPCNRATPIIVRDAWFPGWRAYCGGERVPIASPDGFRHVTASLPQDVWFVFQSPSLQVGAALTFFLLAMWAGLLTVWSLRRLVFFPD